MTVLSTRLEMSALQQQEDDRHPPDPKYKLIEATRPFIEVHRRVLGAAEVISYNAAISACGNCETLGR